MSRQAVTKHVALLEKANLISSQWQGREKLHYLNPVPINEIYTRWIGKFERGDFKHLTISNKHSRRIAMNKSEFVYTTYIKTTAEKLWNALTNPEFTKQYWFGAHCESDWKVGASWKLIMEDGKVADTGEILESDPPTRLVIKWRNEWKPEMKADGYSRCVFDIEPAEGAVKLTVTIRLTRRSPSSLRVFWRMAESSFKS